MSNLNSCLFNNLIRFGNFPNKLRFACKQKHIVQAEKSQLFVGDWEFGFFILFQKLSLNFNPKCKLNMPSSVCIPPMGKTSIFRSYLFEVILIWSNPIIPTTYDQLIL